MVVGTLQEMGCCLLDLYGASIQSLQLHLSPEKSDVFLFQSSAQYPHMFQCSVSMLCLSTNASSEAEGDGAVCKYDLISDFNSLIVCWESPVSFASSLSNVDCSRPLFLRPSKLFLAFYS